jgi:hypothetical protein
VELFLLFVTPCFITLPLFSRLSYRWKWNATYKKKSAGVKCPIF